MLNLIFHFLSGKDMRKVMIKNIFEICTPLPLAFPRGRTACRRHTFEAMSPPPTRRQRHPQTYSLLLDVPCAWQLAQTLVDERPGESVGNSWFCVCKSKTHACHLYADKKALGRASAIFTIYGRCQLHSLGAVCSYSGNDRHQLRWICIWLHGPRT